MRVLVLGGRGAVGVAATMALRVNGHIVRAAGRRGNHDDIVLDASTSAGLSRLTEEARRVDVVIDASGLELPGVQAAVGDIPLVDVSATAVHLERLAARVGQSGTVILGAGIAPGASTVLIQALRPAAGDDIDLAVMLGTGEAHGAAAIEWTGRLAGANIYAAPELYPVVNLRSKRRFRESRGSNRSYLRADFPDDLLIGRPSGAAVRSWLALDSRLATAALGLVGAIPALAPVLSRAPHVGSDSWSVKAIHRASGEMLTVSGRGQSVATGRLAALAAERLVEKELRGAMTMAAVISANELELACGVTLHTGFYTR